MTVKHQSYHPKRPDAEFPRSAKSLSLPLLETSDGKQHSERTSHVRALHADTLVVDACWSLSAKKTRNKGSDEANMAAARSTANCEVPESRFFLCVWRLKEAFCLKALAFASPDSGMCGEVLEACGCWYHVVFQYLLESWILVVLNIISPYYTPKKVDNCHDNPNPPRQHIPTMQQWWSSQTSPWSLYIAIQQ